MSLVCSFEGMYIQVALYCSIVTYVPALPWFYYFLFVVESSWRTTLTRAISLLSVDLNPMLNVINPRRACAARVIVLGLSFRPSVCLLPRFLPLRATRRPKSDTNGFSATLALFLK